MGAETIWGIVGTVLAVIGLAASYYFYRKSIRAKEPCFFFRSYNLIQGLDSKLDNLKISYGDNKIENLTVSRMLLWNNGLETIERSDIATVNPVRIVGIEGLKFLDAKILAQNNHSSQFRVNIAEDSESILLDFDYFDHNQGCVIQIVHTGTSSKDVQLVGDIKGVKLLRNKAPRSRLYWIANIPNRIIDVIRSHPKISYFLGVMMGIFYIIFGFFVYLNPRPKQPNPKIFFAILFSFLGFMLLSMSLFSLRQVFSPPKGLEIFDSEWFS
jgi:hypothetical protein